MKADGKILRTALIGILIIVVLLKVYAAVVPVAQDSSDDWQYYGTELTVQASCENAGCFWNNTRVVDCSTTGRGSAYTTACSVRRTIPMSGLFTADGIVFIIVMVALFIGIVMTFIGKKKSF